ncbi:MAG: Uma2 family endonuclease [Epsilonproteobacteria bacterium]|nr:Uma2 family endonuclease [Campylobacterota bacterium]
MQVIPPRYGYGFYKNLKDEWELIDGYLFNFISPFKRHEKVTINLMRIFLKQVVAKGCEIYPEIEYMVNQYTVLRPDLVIHCGSMDEHDKTAPKIIIEIVDDVTAQRAEKIKYDIYEEEKVYFYVLVYPDRKKVKVYKNTGGFEKVYEGCGKFQFDLYKYDVNFEEVFD